MAYGVIMYYHLHMPLYIVATFAEYSNLIYKTFEGHAECEKCSMEWFFGFKLHLIINDKGEFLNFIFTSGNMDEREPLKQGKFLENIKEKLCVDKGYIGQALFENLFFNSIQGNLNLDFYSRMSLISSLPNLEIRSRIAVSPFRF